MIYPQMLLDIHDELIVDLFAGGGGASVGIEMATGRQVDLAINHDAAAVALHQRNHPQTQHHVSDVFEVDPREVTNGRRVGLLWASPDCTYHSKARGAKPIRSKNRKRRALAWVVTRWAGQVRPRVIVLENVEEFAKWGPLVAKRDPETGRVIKGYEENEDGKVIPIVAAPGIRTPLDDQQLVPCAVRESRTFRKWIRSLERLGYTVEYRELRACDYGAPTIRKRLFLIARCDGQPIVWPQATHGPGTRRPYRTAAECIDWSTPMLSIFATREEARAWGTAHGQASPVRPLAEATMRRIARGVVRYVIQAAEPFIVPLTHGRDSFRGQSINDPVRTVTGAQRGEQALVAPYLVPRYGEREGQHPRTRSAEEPLPAIVPTGNGAQLVAPHLSSYHAEKRDGDTRAAALDGPSATIDTSNRHALVSAFLAKNYSGVVGSPLSEPKGTVTTIDHDSLVAAHIQRDFGNSVGHAATEPAGTITPGGGGKVAVVAAHLTHQYTSNTAGGAGDPERPAKTITTGGHAAIVYSFLQKYYGTDQDPQLRDALHTVTTKDRFSLVTVHVAGKPYVIFDIAMRMLQPRELYNAQGFPPDYSIDRGADGRRLTKTEQVRMVGNSVCPPIAAALVRANAPELRARDEVAA